MAARGNKLLLNEVVTGNGHDSSPLVPDQSIKQGEQPVAEHFVQFYESEDFLIDSMTTFVSSGLDSDETVLVLATGQHLNALHNRLVEQQISVDYLETAGSSGIFWTTQLSSLHRMAEFGCG